jgi:predicted DNA-binding antitoxin AbrB/MazE fold protein
MTIHMNAIFENGLLRPLRPLPLTERQEVQLQIETGKVADPRLLSAIEVERLIGELADDEPRDLSHLPEVLTREDFYEDRL